EEEPKLKEIKKEAGTTSESVTEKVVKEKVVAEKADAVMAKKPKKKDLKRKTSGIRIDEGRSKLKHDKARKE
ncbi:hypothetical protein A2U01_0107368, partial [Trifolium medium]|nr:hypothetical protein [Trifolium medium]